ncbi:hypothetical protein AB0K12_37765 [Nonomuraea sp. NPDC049419]
MFERLNWATNVHWQPADVLGHPRMVAGRHTLRTSTHPSALRGR